MSTQDAFTLPFEPEATAVERPRELFAHVNGVTGVRAATTRLVGDDRFIDVWMFGDPPADANSPSAWTLIPAQGAPVPTVTASTIVPAASDAFGAPVPSHLTLTLDAVLPATSGYRLRLDPTVVELDPLRISVPVKLRPECEAASDCAPSLTFLPPLAPPDYDTLARDYAALRSTLMERRSALSPGADESPADLGVTLVELFAHLGDVLNYRLDRVSTESWLPTARRRASVTRHARAVDFAVLPAISAATTVQVIVGAAAAEDDSVTVLPGDLAADDPGPGGSPDVHGSFTLELDGPVTVRKCHAELALDNVIEGDAALGIGATSAILVVPAAVAAVPLADWLPVGSLLGFEVVAVDDLDEQNAWAAGGARPAAWPWPRPALASWPAQVVTVTGAVAFVDPLRPGLPLVRIFWDDSEALVAPVPASVDTGTADEIGLGERQGPVVGVARLGLFRAHNGLPVDGPGAVAAYDRLRGLPADPQTSSVADYLLTQAGSEAAPGLSRAPGGRLWQLDTTVALPNGTTVSAQTVPSMLSAPASGFSVVVDTDDELPATLRFRTGALGLVPPTGSTVTARYQIGAGPAANVAAHVTEALLRGVSAVGAPLSWQRVTSLGGAAVSAENLTPGTGGTAAMPLDAVRRDAPQAYSAVARRAVLISDLPQFAAAQQGVRRASARRSWSGSWPVGIVAYESTAGGAAALDPSDAAALHARVQSGLDGVRMIGTEVVAVPATPVGILIALTVCVFPGTDASMTRARILALLRPGDPRAGTHGFFAPGAFPLGADVYLSAVVALVASLPQVDAVVVTEARRLSEAPGGVASVLTMSASEVAVCDDDPDFPDRGRIELTIEGGR